MREMESTRRKLCCKKEVLKTSGSEEADVIKSTSLEAVRQKLMSSEVLKIIRS